MMTSTFNNKHENVKTDILLSGFFVVLVDVVVAAAVFAGVPEIFFVWFVCCSFLACDLTGSFSQNGRRWKTYEATSLMYDIVVKQMNVSLSVCLSIHPSVRLYIHPAKRNQVKPRSMA